MITANRVVPDRYGVINIGKLKENLVTEVSLPAPGFAGGSYAVLLKRPKEEQPYPVSVRHDGGNLVWTVQTADTAIAGMGKLECRWYGDNGEVAKSQIYTVRITDGLPDPTEAPEAWAGFMQQVSQDAGRAESAADNATKVLKKLEDGIASGDFRGEKGEQGEKGDPGPQGPKGETGPAGDTTAADAAAEAAKAAAQEAQKAAEASAGSAAQAAESVGGLADDLEATQKDLAKMKRAIKFQAELNQGQTWDFEEDTQDAYQRQVPSGAKAGAVMEWGGKTRRGKNVIPLVLSKSEQNVYTQVSGVTISVKNTAAKNCYPQTEWFELPAGTYCAVQSDANVETYLQLASGDYSHVLKGQGYIVFTLDAATPVRYMLSVGAGINFSMAIQTVRGSTPDYDFEPYTPDLVSALVDEVRVRGKNLVEINGPVGNDTYKLHAKIPAHTMVCASFTGTASADKDTFLSMFLHSDYGYTSGNSLQFGKVSKGTKRYTATVTPSYVVTAAKVFKDSFWNLFDSVTDFQLEISSTPTAYSPYHEDLYPIPSAVRNLPGYGWSAGSVANTVEQTENGWQYVQRVGSVDLGTLDYTKEKNTFRAKLQDMQIVSTDVAFNGRCKSFISIRYRDSWTVDGTMSQDSAKRLVLIHSGYSNIESFLPYVRGTLLYYELATPITTDITALMGDSLAPFAVEAGGSITLHHPKADEGFAINVPAKIQYITKLSEVSANG